MQLPSTIRQLHSGAACERCDEVDSFGSVSHQVYPFVGYHRLKFYWGHKEVLIPVYKSISDAIKKHTDADCLINFASLRSAKESTDEAINCPQIRTIAIIAEGIPENVTRKINKAANERGSLNS